MLALPRMVSRFVSLTAGEYKHLSFLVSAQIIAFALPLTTFRKFCGDKNSGQAVRPLGDCLTAALDFQILNESMCEKIG